MAKAIYILAKLSKRADSVDEIEIDKITEKHGRNISFHGQLWFFYVLYKSFWIYCMEETA